MSKLIMVVDGVQDILDLYREILTGEGYEVSLHSIEDTDLDAVIAVRPDLIITDLRFGHEEEGWQFIQKLRMSPATTAIPLIFSTDNVRKVQELDGQLRSLNIMVIIKPFNIHDLIVAVDKVFGKPK